MWREPIFCRLSLSPFSCPLASIISLMSFEGRTALVTGASQGIGRACAVTLARAGARVALAARNEGKLAEVAEEIRAGGGVAEVFLIDMASEESIKAGAKAALGHFGSIEILVNNAGITKDGLLLRMKRADWDDVLATNLTGTFLMTQALMSPMMKARWGRIINISSVVGEAGQAGQANYAASKAGLIGFTKSLARELASRGITANAVAPGYIETAMTAVLDEKQREAMTTQIPLGRAGTEQDVANAVCVLVCFQASARQNAASRARHIAELTNRDRQTHGLDRLQWDDSLAAAAQAHAERMAEEDELSHQY